MNYKLKRETVKKLTVDDLKKVIGGRVVPAVIEDRTNHKIETIE